MVCFCLRCLFSAILAGPAAGTKVILTSIEAAAKVVMHKFESCDGGSGTGWGRRKNVKERKERDVEWRKRVEFEAAWLAGKVTLGTLR